MQDTFGMNMVALLDGQPRLLNLKQILDAFLRHRREVVTRRTVFGLKKPRERGHLLEGLAVALSNVDEIIALIKAAPTPADAMEALMARTWHSTLVQEMLTRALADAQALRPEGLDQAFGIQAQGYRLSDAQAQAILELRLQRLTGLEQEKIVDEYREVIDKIIDFLDMLTAELPSIVDLVLAARALRQQGRLAEALPLAAKATELEAVAARAPRASGRAVYGDVLREAGQVAESRAVLEAALDYWQAQRERDGVQMNPRLAEVQLALARTLQRQAENPERQAELLRSALNIRRQVMGPNHPWTRDIESRLKASLR